jgi:hypothetical protein
MSYGTPIRDYESWDTVVLTDASGQTVSLPPRERVGTARVSVASEQKIDKKTAAGKKGATRTQQGAEAAEGTIEYEFADHAWLDVEPGLAAIDPRGPSKGGPFLLTAPNLPPGFEYVLIQRIDRGSAIFSRGRGKVRITVVETTFTKAVIGGGAAAKKKAGMTEAEAVVLRAERETLLFLIRQDEIVVWSSNDDDTREGARLRQQERAIRVSEIDRLLAAGEAVPLNAPGTSETKTPTKPGNTPGGPTIQEGKISDLESDSYDTSKNPDAPPGGP